MAQKSPNLIERNLSNARKILFTIARLLDQHKIPYHLEGGTLLGIVRDNDLLPWDTDVDISVPYEYANQIPKLKGALLLLGYRLSVRKSKLESGPIKKGDYSVFKVKPIWGYVLRWFYPSYEIVVLDIFVKTTDSNHTYWQAVEKPMRVNKKFYNSFETIEYRGHQLKVPNHYEEYLTEKYGDWSVPVKEWDCAVNERTIIH